MLGPFSRTRAFILIGARLKELHASQAATALRSFRLPNLRTQCPLRLPQFDLPMAPAEIATIAENEHGSAFEVPFLFWPPVYTVTKDGIFLDNSLNSLPA